MEEVSVETLSRLTAIVKSATAQLKAVNEAMER